jgi:hypothetical protein
MPPPQLRVIHPPAVIQKLAGHFLFFFRIIEVFIRLVRATAGLEVFGVGHAKRVIIINLHDLRFIIFTRCDDKTDIAEVVFQVISKLRRSIAKVYNAIAVEDAAGQVVFDYKIAVVLLVAGKVAVAVESLSRRMKVFC